MTLSAAFLLPALAFLPQNGDEGLIRVNTRLVLVDVVVQVVVRDVATGEAGSLRIPIGLD